LAREFKQWTPAVNIVVLTGTKEERADIIANQLIPQDFEVCITSYEICLIEKSAFKKFSFEYITIDEAHRIKNVAFVPKKGLCALAGKSTCLRTEVENMAVLPVADWQHRMELR
jgi:hypothetical protein